MEVSKVKAMIDEMLEKASATSIAEASGITNLTIGRIKNDKAERVSEKVSTAIEQCYNDWKLGKVQLKKGKRGRTAGSGTGTKPPKKGLSIDQQIRELERQLESVETIKIKIQSLKKVKELQERHEQEMMELQQKQKAEIEKLKAGD